MSECMHIKDQENDLVVIRNVQMHITIPSKTAVLTDSSIEPETANVFAGSHQGRIILGMKTSKEHAFGFYMDCDTALAIGKQLIKEAVGTGEQ